MKAICVNNSQEWGSNSLIEGKIYEVRITCDWQGKFYDIYEGDSWHGGYAFKRFVLLKELRKNKLEKISKCH